jgi:phosphatidate cytidylyltransferase
MGPPNLVPYWDEANTRLVAAMFAVMIFMTAIALLLRGTARTETRRRFASDFGARTVAWWVLVAIYIPAVLAGGGVLLGLFALTALLAWYEFTGITRTAALRPRDLLWAAPLVAWHFLAIAERLPGAPWLPAVGAAGLIGGVTTTRGGPDRGGGLRWRLVGFIYCVLVLSLGPVIALRFGGEYLFFICVVVPAGDVFQYICGKLWGRRLLAPVLSPKKTWEGLIGGLIATALLGAALAPLIHASRATGLAWGGLLGLAGTAGGLLMSAVKRHWGAKDFSRLLPGQGGLLDRFDSLASAFAAAAAALYFGG